MAHTHIHSAAGAFSGPISGDTTLVGRVTRLIGRLANYRQLRRAERELNALDDRMLADIGIVRTEIHKRVWGG
jgi:uncharacterized protein YjiS (DUF1127 family)